MVKFDGLTGDKYNDIQTIMLNANEYNYSDDIGALDKQLMLVDRLSRTYGISKMQIFRYATGERNPRKPLKPKVKR